MERPIYVDANVFIAMLERSDTLAGLLLQLLQTSAKSGVPHFLTSELTLAEVLVVPIRTAVVSVKEVDRPTLSSAARIRAESPFTRLPDAIHLATATRSGCSRFLTYDRRLNAAKVDRPQPSPLDDFDRLEIILPDEGSIELLISELSP